ncbi:MAG: ATP-binding protein [Candidatus Anstonellales archaeon]
MLFDPKPKDRVSDLFNYKEELRALLSGMGSKKIIIIKGVRRIGKTSLLKVAMNETKLPCVYMDGRFYSNRKEFMNGLKDALLQLHSKASIRGKIGKILPKKLELYGIRIGLASEDLIELSKKVDREIEKGVLIVDEAQKLKRFGGDEIFAALYDATKNINFVFSGSEIGLIEEFIGSSAGSLYGRAVETIELRRLQREQSLEFLRRGFLENKKEWKEEEIEEAVDELDGIIGWLTLYGYFRLSNTHKTALKRINEEAIKIAKDELEAFLRNKQEAGKRYLMILKAIAEAPRSWSDIRMVIEIEEKKRISEGRIFEYLKNLMAYSLVEKREGTYRISDPVLQTAIKKMGRK